ncbi:MAG: hypothetical protein J0G30_00520 [Actinomycetales bacterium]|nr:hypothetical protein [Actinomycetales bacterium]
MNRHARPSGSPIKAFVTVVIRGEADVEIRVDGRLYIAGPISRSAVPGMVKAICEELQTHLDVVVTETDGSQASFEVFYRRESRFAPPAEEVPTPPPPRAISPFVITADGFIPGEDVDVAVVFRSGSVDGDGVARGLIDPRQLGDGVRAVILFGNVSGTVHRESIE